MVNLAFTDLPHVLLGLMFVCVLLLYRWQWRDYTILSGAYGQVEGRDREALPRLSIIVPYVQHQMGDIEDFLASLYTYDYPDYEVILTKCDTEGIDKERLAHLCKRFLHLRSTGIPKDSPYANPYWLGLTLGVRAAYGEWVVVMPPGAFAASTDWLQHMMCLALREHLQVVQAYVNFADEHTRRSRRAVYERLRQQLMRQRASHRGRSVGSETTGVLMRKDFFMSHCQSLRNMRSPFGGLDYMLDGQPESGKLHVLLSPETTLLQPLPSRRVMKTYRHTIRKASQKKSLRFQLYRLRSHGARLLLWCHLLLAIAYTTFSVHVFARTHCYTLSALMLDSIFLLLFVTALLVPTLRMRRCVKRLGERRFGLYPYFFDLLHV